MNRRQLLKSSLSLAGGTFLTQILPANETNLQSILRLTYTGIQPFRINFSRERIKDLHRRLDNTLWPEMPFDSGWSVGTNDKMLKDLVSYWRNEYDWFKEQNKLNQLPNFKTPIEGEQMHFLHCKGSGQRQKFPLLLMHGWPGSFLEFQDAIPLLLNGLNGKAGYDLIIPSLPGFVFSDAPKQPGLHPGKIAKRMHSLMTALGFERYGIAGGDWGSVIGGEQARQFPSAIVGFHGAGMSWKRPPADKVLNEEEKKYVASRAQFDREGFGYQSIQGTKPQTLSYGLQDSPVGLLAWILEKYWAWSDHEDLWQTFKRNQILTTVTLYWLTGKVLSAARIYYENRMTPESEKGQTPITVPVARTGFPKDPFSSGAPSSLIDSGNYKNIVQMTDFPKGGHFPALEQPDLWAKDVVSFFSKL